LASHHGELLRNTRHHNIRAAIANELRGKGLEVYEEVTCTGENDSVRRVDIIAINRSLKKGYIIDPTVRYENDESQAELTDIEKRSIYEPCIPYFLLFYNLKEVEVIGLLVGARGSIPTFFVNFCKRFRLSSCFIYKIVLLALKGSIALFRNHLYGQGHRAQ
jgi:hypothetical protein